jgi:hypothetical protein
MERGYLTEAEEGNVSMKGGEETSRLFYVISGDSYGKGGGILVISAQELVYGRGNLGVPDRIKFKNSYREMFFCLSCPAIVFGIICSTMEVYRE